MRKVGVGRCMGGIGVDGREEGRAKDEGACCLHTKSMQGMSE